MNDDKKAKRKDWVKNIAIIFLLIMLVLTLFSNTIKNYSLPVVTMINPSQTTIKEQARGTGTIEAGEKYTVKATESRIISSVAVKKGDHVEKGDVLYYLEDKDSEELKKAEEELKKLETDYLTSLFDGNASDETIIKVKSGNFESLGSYQARLAKINSEIEEKKKEKEEYNNYITSLKITKTYEDSLRNTYSIDNIIAAITYQKEIAGYENT
ncbi:MAG: efflux RND transporter periplasmic adaptor subunit, partial [Lachnospiraceae bacterium]|nr:efflux RND transporter periplasmic adaptor subunit [Lachnospiraceae bacterium]